MINFFTVQNYSKTHAIIILSVCLSICHTSHLCQNSLTYYQNCHHLETQSLGFSQMKHHGMSEWSTKLLVVKMTANGNGTGHNNEVTLCPVGLVLGSVTSHGDTVFVCN